MIPNAEWLRVAANTVAESMGLGEVDRPRLEDLGELLITAERSRWCRALGIRVDNGKEFCDDALEDLRLGNKIASDLMGVDDGIWMPKGVPVDEQGNMKVTGLVFAKRVPPVVGVNGEIHVVVGEVYTLAVVHERWERGGDPQPTHPISYLIRAWLRTPWDATPFVPTNRAILPRIHKVVAVVDSSPPVDPSTLPLFGTSKQNNPNWLLAAYDRLGGKSMQRGRGAPWELRLFVYVCMHLGTDDRDGLPHTLRFKEKAVMNWLFPNSKGKNINEKRDPHKMARALMALLEMPSLRTTSGLFLVMPTNFTSAGQFTGGDLTFDVAVPGDAKGGADVDWQQLLRYGAEGARMFRGFLSTMAHMDRSAHNGHPLTRQIHPAKLNTEGEPLRKRGGMVRRDMAQLVPNPAAKLALPLSDGALAELYGYPNNKKGRLRAREVLSRLQRDGVVEVDHTPGGLKFYKPLNDGGTARLDAPHP